MDEPVRMTRHMDVMKMKHCRVEERARAEYALIEAPHPGCPPALHARPLLQGYAELSLRVRISDAHAAQRAPLLILKNSSRRR